MIVEEHIFNPHYSADWQEKPMLVFPSLRNIKMAFNFLVAKIQCKLSMTRLISYPYFALIDPSSPCNLHCPLCPTGQGDPSRPRRFLKFEDFKKIIDELGDYLISLLLTNWGEPLLNKEFFKMVEYTKKVKRVPYISIDTNLNVTLSDQDIERLIKSGLDLMCVAVDGATQETYEKYRRGGSLKKVIENSRRILEKRRDLGKDRPFVVWMFLVFKHNQHEIENIKKMAKEMGVDALRISAARVYTGRADKRFKDSYEISKKYLPPLGSKFSDYTKSGLRRRAVKRCYWLWNGVVINSDGSVSPCCEIFPKKYDFGNILNEKSFKTIWNNEKYRNARKSVKDFKHAKKLFDKENVCAKCTVYGNWF